MSNTELKTPNTLAPVTTPDAWARDVEPCKSVLSVLRHQISQSQMRVSHTFQQDLSLAIHVEHEACNTLMILMNKHLYMLIVAPDKALDFSVYAPDQNGTNCSHNDDDWNRDGKDSHDR
jgi:hypothetical protein